MKWRPAEKGKLELPDKSRRSGSMHVAVTASRTNIVFTA